MLCKRLLDRSASQDISHTLIISLCQFRQELEDFIELVLWNGDSTIFRAVQHDDVALLVSEEHDSR